MVKAVDLTDRLPKSTDIPADKRAYRQQHKFGRDSFQIVTGGMYGCMVSLDLEIRDIGVGAHCMRLTVTLVSNRPVLMAHF